jgi:transmembrane sensor
MTRKVQALSPNKLNEAIAWHVRISSPNFDETVWMEFASWLDAEEANRIAFDRIEEFDSELTTLAPSLGSWAPQARAYAMPKSWAEALQRFRFSRRVWMPGAAVIAVSIILAVVVVTNSQKSIEYATQIGEVRTVMLSNGTKIDLNTATKIFVASEGEDRHVVLAQGEALFHVSNDPTHPFVVTVGDRDVRDAGTVFNVLRNQGVITVTVAEGKVVISPRGKVQNVDEIRLSQGEQLVHSEDNGTTTVRHADVEQALAWRNGYLIYDNAPLSTVVRDLNRYFPNHVIIENKAIAMRRFSGVLRVDNEYAVLDRISKFLPVTVQRQQNGDIILRNSTKGD